MGGYNQNHHRRSIRLPGADYSVPGFYFVTICTKNREHLFGKIIDGEMMLNDFGKIIHNEWARTSELRPNVIIDEFVVMPNHFHGIILITDQMVRHVDGRGVLIYAPQLSGQRLSVQQSHRSPDNQPDNPPANRGVYQYAPTDERPFVSPSQSVGAIIRGFKSATTARINTIRQTPANPVWQRNYHEHIIHNQNALNRIRQYIQGNPFNWPTDIENPQFALRFDTKNREKEIARHYKELLQ
ncbi:MAG TPA: transposase [Patescibacteria group bacterium]|nr:transposase [Patescibacteria group bacterium]